MYALDAATGHFRWSYPTGGPVLSGPAVVDGTVYVGSTVYLGSTEVYGKVYALSAGT